MGSDPRPWAHVVNAQPLTIIVTLASLTVEDLASKATLLIATTASTSSVELKSLNLLTFPEI